LIKGKMFLTISLWLLISMSSLMNLPDAI
jgi:hypothetical protein